MNAYIIVGFNPINTDRLQEYAAQVPTTLAPFEGEVIAKGPAEVLHGDSDYQVQVLLNFPSKQQAQDWYHSDAYQALIPVRNVAMDASFKLLG
jgi:uncharacterized protein (DUF1330 family)